MYKALDPSAVPQPPTQQRAKLRFERILAEARELLAEAGLTGFSIPVLAERLGYTRGIIYKYFPTPYAILNELAKRYLDELEAIFLDHKPQLSTMNWRQSVHLVVDVGTQFYNSHTVARMLILGGPATDHHFRAQEQTNKRLGELGRSLWAPGLRLPAAPPDVLTLSVDIATACFRRSFFEHGEITPEYRDAAIVAMTAFLERYIEDAAPGARGARDS